MAMKTNIPGYYTVEEAAKALKKTKFDIYGYIRRNGLQVKRVGHTILIEQTNLHEFVPSPRGNPNFRNRRTG
jgi:excisionase family DNA binding protein